MIKNFTKFYILKKNGGYTIVETLFYILLFMILSIAVINAMFIMTKAFKETAIQSELMRGGNVMEKISREIRKSYAVNSINSTSLKLNIKDDIGVNKTVEFSLFNSDVRFLENDIFIDNLNTENIDVIVLTFTQINTIKGTAVKIFLTVKSNHDSQNREESFYNTVVLRGSY